MHQQADVQIGLLDRVPLLLYPFRLTEALKDAAHLQGGVVPALALPDGSLVRLQPVAQGFGTDAVQGCQLGDGTGFSFAFGRSAHGMLYSMSLSFVLFGVCWLNRNVLHHYS